VGNFLYRGNPRTTLPAKSTQNLLLKHNIGIWVINEGGIAAPAANIVVKNSDTGYSIPQIDYPVHDLYTSSS
jgi:hypothetical protein